MIKDIEKLKQEFIEKWEPKGFTERDDYKLLLDFESDLNTLLAETAEKQREACYMEYKEKQAENIVGKVKEAWNVEGGQMHDLGKAIINTPLITQTTEE